MEQNWQKFLLSKSLGTSAKIFFLSELYNILEDKRTTEENKTRGCIIYLYNVL